MVRCQICGKGFKNTQGLAGHRRLSHGQNAPSNKSPAAEVATEAAAREQLSDAELSIIIIDEQLAIYEGQLDALKGHVHGIAEQLAAMDEHSVNTERALNQRLEPLEQLSARVRQNTDSLQQQRHELTELVEKTDRDHQRVVVDLRNKIAEVQRALSSVNVMLGGTLLERAIKAASNGDRVPDSRLVDIEERLSRVEGRTRKGPRGSV